MKLIVGLGNPGEKYANTRHNVGFMVVDQIAQMVNGQWSMIKKFNSLIINNKQSLANNVGQPSTILSKPQTFMNDSGIAVSKMMNFYKIQSSELYIIHDDLDIKLGEYKIQKGIGPKVHNGVNSIEEKLGTKDFWRVRVGVDNRNSENRLPGEEYVLQNFNNMEEKILNKVISEIVGEFNKLIL